MVRKAGDSKPTKAVKGKSQAILKAKAASKAAAVSQSKSLPPKSKDGHRPG